VAGNLPNAQRTAENRRRRKLRKQGSNANREPMQRRTVQHLQSGLRWNSQTENTATIATA